MSYETRTWAWNLMALRPATKLTLMVLADVADEEGRVAYCSHKRMCKLTNQSEGTVKRIIKELAALTLLVRLPRFVSPEGVVNHVGIGRQTSDGFVLHTRVTSDALDIIVAEQKALAKARGAAEHFDDDVGEGSESDPPSDSDETIENGPPGESPVDPLKEDSKRKIPTPTPPKGGVLKIEDDSETKESFERFRSAYPITIEDEPRALKTWRLLSPADREIRITAAARYADEVKRYKRTPFAAHRWLGDGTPKREGRWQGYATTGTLTATAPTSSVVPFDSRAAKALVTVCRVLGMSSPPRCSTGYVCSAPITPQILALADAPPESEWIEHAIGTQRAGAWRSLRELLPPRWGMPRLEKIRSPWEWPPRVDGTLSPTGPSESTGPPQSLMTADDERALTDGL